MKAALKRIHSPDVDFKDYWPEEEDRFSFLLQAMIGPEESDASESFDIVVCTPRWLAENCHEPMWGRHMLIVPNYDIGRIEKMISQYCSSCTGKDWETIAKSLSQIGRWEFEGYQK